MLKPKNRLAKWIQKKKKIHIYIYMLSSRHPLHFKGKIKTNKLNVRGWKKILHANRNHKKAGVAILISDKIDVKMNNILRDKEGHYMMIKESIQENI